MARKLNLDIVHNKAYDKNVEIIFHSHDTYEIYVFVDGSVTYYIEEKEYNLIPGDVLIIPPWQMHRPVFTEDNDIYERFVLALDPSYIHTLSSEEVDLFTCFKEISKRGSHLFHCDPNNFDNLTTLLVKTIEETNSTQFGSCLLCSALVTQVLVLINRLYYSSTTKAATIPDDALISKVIAYINNNLCECLTLEKLCDEFFISSGHLIREFKKYTNTTVYNYILTKRIAYSKMLIRQGHSLTSSCHASGFNDYSNYYKTFKTKVGMTPSEYKEMINEP